MSAPEYAGWYDMGTGEFVVVRKTDAEYLRRPQGYCIAFTPKESAHIYRFDHGPSPFRVSDAPMSWQTEGSVAYWAAM